MWMYERHVELNFKQFKHEQVVKSILNETKIEQDKAKVKWAQVSEQIWNVEFDKNQYRFESQIRPCNYEQPTDPR